MISRPSAWHVDGYGFGVRIPWLVALLVAPFACDGGGDALEPACDAPAVAPSKGACFLGGACNPVTNEACPSTQACDVWVRDQVDLGYQCVDLSSTQTFIASSHQAVCETCAADNGDDARYLCSPTLACLAGRCARYCCDDGDCGEMGQCDKEGVLGGVGICVQSDDAREGS